MNGRTERLQAVVEVALDAAGRVPAALLHRAYGASRSGRVALCLTDVDARMVDASMDAIVPQFPLDILGVDYIRTSDTTALSRAVSICGDVFGDSPAFLEAMRALAPRMCVRPTWAFPRRGLGGRLQPDAAGLGNGPALAAAAERHFVPADPGGEPR